MLRLAAIFASTGSFSSIYIIVDNNVSFRGVLAMQSASIFGERPTPGYRHSEEQSVEPRIVEALAEVATCGDDHTFLSV